MMRNRRTHETSRVGLVGSDLVVNHNESLLDDERDLTTSESVLESVSEEDLEMAPIEVRPCCSTRLILLLLRITAHPSTSLRYLRRRFHSPIDGDIIIRNVDLRSKEDTLGACEVRETDEGRKLPRVCRASRRMEPQDASSAFSVHVPTQSKRFESAKRRRRWWCVCGVGMVVSRSERA